ncbi:hypothetical protein RCH21_000506 [Arthrobacter sp. PL16]|uniref:hypothetical protein n=1 Tax=Arthrobacter sp. PL16 TaxID=3071720 RepID=UPI002DFEF210|nr:hypothetical protein [Arthrobacter sp. PL16]
MRSSIKSLAVTLSAVAAVVVAPLACDFQGPGHTWAFGSVQRDVLPVSTPGEEAGSATASVAPQEVLPTPDTPSRHSAGPGTPGLVVAGAVPAGLQSPVAAVPESASTSGQTAWATSAAAVADAATPGSSAIDPLVIPPLEPTIDLPVDLPGTSPSTIDPSVGVVTVTPAPVIDQPLPADVGPAAAGSGADAPQTGGQGGGGVGSGMGGDLPPETLPEPSYPQCPITEAGAWWTEPSDPYTCLPPQSIPFHEPTPPGIPPELLEPIFEEPGTGTDAAGVEAQEVRPAGN